MGTGPASDRDAGGPGVADPAVRRFEEEWRQGRPDLGRHLADSGRGGSVSLLAALVKVDLRGRYDRGERPAAAEYLERFPDLVASGERVLSLVYEEYCLLEERDGRPDTAEFCARYEAWKDSLESQLRYHRVLSAVVGSAPPPPRFPAPGERFGPFLIGSELGRGGAGRVYLARDESLGGREVALKVSHDRGSEPSTMGRLRHPHIVPVHSVVYEDRDGTKLRGLCMTYRPGLPLDEVIRLVGPSKAKRAARGRALQDALRVDPAAAPGDPVAGGPGWATFPAGRSYARGVAWVIAVLADALGHAHGQDVFHRDVKPANVLLTYRDGPQLLDFNLSHDPHSAVEAEAALRGGTLPYMAPEQLEAFLDPGRWGKVVGPADLYSLGLVLCELLTGRAPETPDPALPLPRAIRALLDQRAAYRTDLRRLNPAVPHALEAIAARCLAYDPADRYPDAPALADDLRRFLARRPLKHARNRSTRERTVNWVVRNRLPLAAAVLSAALAAATYKFPGTAGRRPGIADAVAALDADRAEPALDILKRLGPGAGDSPLVAFYIAAAHARLGHAAEADGALARAWSRPEAGTELTAWGRSHPKLVGHAERLAVTTFRQTTGVVGTLKSARLDRAAQAYRLALRLDPSSYWAREGLAVVDESRERYSSAHDALTAVIASIGVPAKADNRKRLTTSLMTRARVSARWAGSLPRTKEGAISAVAETHLRAALADLDRGDRSVDPADLDTRFDLNYIRCDTVLALAGASARGGRYPEALDFYDQAGRLLDTLADHPVAKDPAYRALETRVGAQLRTEPPRIRSLMEQETHRGE